MPLGACLTRREQGGPRAKDRPFAELAPCKTLANTACDLHAAQRCVWNACVRAVTSIDPCCSCAASEDPSGRDAVLAQMAGAPSTPCDRRALSIGSSAGHRAPAASTYFKVNTRAELRLDLDRATDTMALPRDVADRLTKHSTKERASSRRAARTQKGNREACEAKLAELLEAWPPKARKLRRASRRTGSARARPTSGAGGTSRQSTAGASTLLSTSASLTARRQAPGKRKRLRPCPRSSRRTRCDARERGAAGSNLVSAAARRGPNELRRRRGPGGVCVPWSADRGLLRRGLHVGPAAKSCWAPSNSCSRRRRAALHYRHLATNVVRALRRGDALEDLLLARSYVVSSADPACGGVHWRVGRR